MNACMRKSLSTASKPKETGEQAIEEEINRYQLMRVKRPVVDIYMHTTALAKGFQAYSNSVFFRVSHWSCSTKCSILRLL